MGRSKLKVNIPNKPHPIGIKVWGIAASNFLIVWNWHIPGQSGGPVNTRIPVALSGSKGKGIGGNKTQAVVAKLMSLLPQDFGQAEDEAPYHLFGDNLFMSNRFLVYMRKDRKIGMTGTTRANAGIVKPILDFVKPNKNDSLP